jgi:hypothetical protein
MTLTERDRQETPMRMSETKLDFLTERIVEMLLERDDIDIFEDAGKLRVLARQAMLDELMVEDRLEDEVREMLKQYDREIRAGQLSYNTIFMRIKNKLMRERDLIL